MDLRELAALGDVLPPTRRILAPYRPDDASLRAAVERLRASGEVVVWDLPGHEGTRDELGCDRELALQAGEAKDVKSHASIWAVGTNCRLSVAS